MAEANHTPDLLERLRNTPNWMRESYGHWKDCTREYDRAPFEAADEIERLREAEQQARDALLAVIRVAEAAKGPCPMDPEDPAAIRNGKFATIAQVAAQGLGWMSGPALASYGAKEDQRG